MREDKANAVADLVKGKGTYDSTMPDGLWDQVHRDPIGHAISSIRRRNWMIAIYEEAYLHGINVSLDNLASHAYAQIKLREWFDKSLEDFEQTFGKHYAQLGQAISGDALGNLQKMIAQGVPVVVVKTASTTTQTATQELSTATTAGKTYTPPSGPKPPISGDNSTILFANEKLAQKCAKSSPTSGFHSVYVHGNAKGFGMKILRHHR